MKTKEKLSKNVWKEISRNLNTKFYEKKVILSLVYIFIPTFMVIMTIFAFWINFLSKEKTLLILIIISVSVLAITFNLIFFILEIKYFSWIKRKREAFLKRKGEKIFKILKKNKEEKKYLSYTKEGRLYIKNKDFFSDQKIKTMIEEMMKSEIFQEIKQKNALHIKNLEKERKEKIEMLVDKFK